jgi:hypothetical protein
MPLLNLSPDEYHALERETAALAEYAREWDLSAYDDYANAWDAQALAHRAAVEQPPQRRPRRTRNLSTLLLVLCFVALAALWPTESHAASRPVCSVVKDTVLVLDGRYGRVECPEGPLTVALPSGIAPVNGPARVQLVARKDVVTYRLVDASRNVYPIVQE